MENNNAFNSKDIKKHILDSTNNLEEVIDFLEKDYQNTIEGIFNAIYLLMKNYEQNKSRIDYLINIIDNIIEIKTIDELKQITGPILDFNHKISIWNLKDKMTIHEPYNQIQNLLNKIHTKERSEVHEEKVKYLSYLIFQDKNLSMIEDFISRNSNLLKIRNSVGDNIFARVLKKYLLLNEANQKDINYFYQVILLFVNHPKYGKIILNDKKEYFRLIKRLKTEYKEHVIKIMEVFDPEFAITPKELEDRYHVHFQFPQIILNEINKFTLDEHGRRDYTYQEIITIDGENAKCLDDAISIEKNKNGTYTLFIHIVDLPSFVPFYSLTNEEAYDRTETQYLRDKNILLYPDYICNNICSLLPNSIRNTITYIFQLDPNFVVLEDKFKIVPGKIKVQHRMTYDQADKKIKHPQNNNLDKMLYELFMFSDVRRKGNKQKEKYRKVQNALDFDPYRESLKIDYSPSANIVHESMVLVNYLIPKFFAEHSLPYLYRELELPSDDFFDKQLTQLMQLDSKYVQSKEFYYKLRQSYAKPKYTNHPNYHQGVNLPYYSHSSSPSRRYSDAYGQYMIHDMIFDKNRSDFDIQAWEYRTEKLAKHLNEQKDVHEIFSNQYNYLSYKKLIKEKRN